MFDPRECQHNGNYREWQIGGDHPQQDRKIGEQKPFDWSLHNSKAHSALLMTPCRPSTRRHAKARTRPLVKNGMVNSARRSAARRGPLNRPTTAAAGTASSVEAAAVSAARPAVRRKTVARPFSRRAAYDAIDQAGLIQ